MGASASPSGWEITASSALLERIALMMGGVSMLSISVLTPCRIDSLCAGALLAAVARRPEGSGWLLRRSHKAAAVLAVLAVGAAAWSAVTHLAAPLMYPL